MRAVSFALLIALLGFATGCGSKPDPAGGDKVGTSAPVETSKSDIDRIQGVWSIESFDSGAELPPALKAGMKTARYQFDGDKMTIRDRPERPGNTMTFKLDPAKDPKTIDVMDEDGGSTSIYKFESDGTLVMAMAQPGVTRPTEFKAVPRDPKGVKKQGVVVAKLRKTDEKPTTALPPRTIPTRFEGKTYKPGDK